MKYDAFISYRHAPLDMEISKKIHTGLETYHVPASVRKQTGKKKIERVFRDQEELPIGSDLNDNLFDALRESEYLIVVCTPETPGSYWVCKEIETFVALHDREHVLAVLADGEPDQSFPLPLTTDSTGHKIEPLAADVRGATPKERDQKLKAELLRLAAPILGCTYDDLRQRHRERILKRNLLAGTIAAAVVAIAGAAFGSYNAVVADNARRSAEAQAQLALEKSELADKNNKQAIQNAMLAAEKSKLADEKSALYDEVQAEYQRKLENQSRFYAEEALKQFDDGNREDAVLIAAEGLPTGRNARPFVAESEYALSTVLRAYDYGKDIGPDRIISHDLAVSKMVLDRFCKHLTVIDSGDTVYAWDCNTWELLLKITPSITEDNYYANVVTAFTDDLGVIVVYDTELIRYDFTGAELGRYQTGKAKIKACEFEDRNDTIFCITENIVYLLSISELKEKEQIKNKSSKGFSGEYSVDDKQNWFAVGHYDFEGEGGLVSVVDLKKNSIKDFELSESYVLEMSVTKNGNLAVVSVNDDFFYENYRSIMMDVFSIKDGKKKYTKELPLDINSIASFRFLMDSRSYDDRNEIVVVADTDMIVYDEMSGDELCRVPLSGEAVALSLNEQDNVAFVGCYGGEILCINTEKGNLYSGSNINTGSEMEDMQLLSDGVVLQRPHDGKIAIMNYHIADNLAALPALSDHCFGLGVAPSSKYYVLDSLTSEDGEITFYDSMGTLIYTFKEKKLITLVNGFYGDIFEVAEMDALYLIDPLSESYKKLVYKDLGLEKSYSRYRLNSSGEYVMLWGSSGLAVISVKDEKVIYNDKEIKEVRNALITPDGTRLLIAQTGTNLMLLDLASGDTLVAEDSALRQVLDADRLAYLKCDCEGKLAAMSCADGYIRLIDLSTFQVIQKLPLQVKMINFFDFTSDSKHMIVQGDDYRVRVYDLETSSCICSFSTTYKIYYMIEGNGKIALCDNYSVNMIDAETFGHLAFVTDAVTYLTETDKFIIVNATDAYSVPYKDYKVLLEEVEKQFPGRTLSDEKKVTYNIE